MTGAEVLQEILSSIEKLNDKVTDLNTSIKLIEANIKILNNRAAGILRESIESTVKSQTILPQQYIAQQSNNLIATELPRGRQLSSDVTENQQQIINNSKSAKTYKKIYGNIIDAASKAQEGVLVRVYDKNNEVCATTETDPIGYWESMVTPGKYVAEYTKQGFKTTNKTFVISQNTKEFEVK